MEPFSLPSAEDAAGEAAMNISQTSFGKEMETDGEAEMEDDEGDVQVYLPRTASVCNNEMKRVMNRSMTGRKLNESFKKAVEDAGPDLEAIKKQFENGRNTPGAQSHNYSVSDVTGDSSSNSSPESMPHEGPIPETLADAHDMIRLQRETIQVSSRIGLEITNKLKAVQEDHATMTELCSELEIENTDQRETIENLQTECIVNVKAISDLKAQLRQTEYQLAIAIEQEQADKDDLTKATKELETKLQDKEEEMVQWSREKVGLVQQKTTMVMRASAQKTKMADIENKFKEELEKNEACLATIEELKSEVETLNQQLQKSKDTTEVIIMKRESTEKATTATHQTEMKAREKTIRDLEESGSKMHDDLTELRATLAQLKEEHHNLKESSVKSHNASKREITELQDQLQAIEIEMNTVEKCGKLLEEEKDRQVHSLQDVVKAKDAALDRVKKEARAAAAADSDKIEELEKKMKKKEKERRDLEQQMEEANKEKFDAQLHEAELTNAKMLKALKDADEARSETDFKYAEQVQRFREQTEKTNDLQRELEQVKSDLAQAQTDIETLEAELKRTNKHHDEVLTDQEVQLKRTKAALEKAESEATTLRQDLSAAKASHETVRTTLASEVGALKDEVTEKKKKIKILKEETEIKHQAQGKTIIETTEEKRELERTIKELEETIKKNAETEAKMQAELRKCHEEWNETKEELQVLGAETAKVAKRLEDEKKASQNSLEKEKDRFEAQLKDVRKEQDEERQRQDDKEARHAATVDGLKHSAAEWQRSGEQRCTEIRTKYQHMLDALERELSGLRVQLERQKDEYTTAKTELNALRGEMRTWEEDRETRAREEHANGMETLRKHLVTQSKEQAKKAASEIDRLKETIVQEQDKVAAGKAKLEELSRANAREMHDERQRYEKQLETTEDEAREERKKQKTIHNEEMTAAKEEVMRLEEEREKIRRDFLRRENELQNQLERHTQQREEEVSWSTKQMKANGDDYQQLSDALAATKQDLEELQTKLRCTESERDEKVAALEMSVQDFVLENTSLKHINTTLKISVDNATVESRAELEKALKIKLDSRREIDELRELVKDTREEKLKLELKIDQIMQMKQNTTSDLRATRQESDANAHRLEESQGEVRDLGEKLRAAEANLGRRGEEVNNLENELRETRKTLRMTQEDLMNAHKKQTEVISELKNREDENEHRSRMLEQTSLKPVRSGAHDKRLEKEYADQLYTLREKEKECTRLKAEYESEIKKRDSDLEVLRSDIRQLTSDMTGETAAGRNVARRLRETEDLCQSLRTERDMHLQQQSDLKRELSKVHGMQKEAEASTQAALCKAAALEVLLEDEKRQHAEKVAKEREKAKSEISEYKRRAADATDENRDLQTALRSSKLRHSTEYNTSSRKGTADVVQHLQGEVLKLQTELDDRTAEANKEKSRAEQLYAELRGVRRGTELQKLTSSKLRSELSSSEIQKQCAEHSKEALASEAVRMHEDLMARAAGAELKTEAHAKRAAKAEEAHGLLEEENKTLQKELLRLRQNLSGAATDKETITHIKANREEVVRDLEGEVKSLKEKQARATNQLERQNKEMESLKRQKEAHSTGESKAVSMLRDTEDRLADLRGRIVDSAAQYEKATLERKSLKYELEASNYREASLRTKLHREGSVALPPPGSPARGGSVFLSPHRFSSK